MNHLYFTLAVALTSQSFLFDYIPTMVRFSPEDQRVAELEATLARVKMRMKTPDIRTHQIMALEQDLEAARAAARFAAANGRRTLTLADIRLLKIKKLEFTLQRMRDRGFDRQHPAIVNLEFELERARQAAGLLPK